MPTSYHSTDDQMSSFFPLIEESAEIKIGYTKSPNGEVPPQQHCLTAESYLCLGTVVQTQKKICNLFFRRHSIV
jgi:hypothetical protein